MQDHETPDFPAGARFRLHGGAQGEVIIRYWSPARRCYGWWLKLDGVYQVRPCWNLPAVAAEAMSEEV